MDTGSEIKFVDVKIGEPVSTDVKLLAGEERKIVSIILLKYEHFLTPLIIKKKKGTRHG